MNEAMLNLDVTKDPGNPIVSTWISSDSHYAFVEFRSSEEANLGFRLQGMNINGAEIKIGRPKAYEGNLGGAGGGLTGLMIPGMEHDISPEDLAELIGRHDDVF